MTTDTLTSQLIALSSALEDSAWQLNNEAVWELQRHIERKVTPVVPRFLTADQPIEKEFTK